MKVEKTPDDPDYKIWIDYMVTQVLLNVNLKRSGACPKYVAEGKVISIEDFYASNQDRRYTGNVDGWYWRFKDRIKL